MGMTKLEDGNEMNFTTYKKICAELRKGNFTLEEANKVEKLIALHNSYISTVVSIIKKIAIRDNISIEQALLKWLQFENEDSIKYLKKHYTCLSREEHITILDSLLNLIDDETMEIFTPPINSTVDNTKKEYLRNRKFVK